MDLAQNKFTHDALRYILPHCGWSEHIREVVVGSVLTERKRDETGKPEFHDIATKAGANFHDYQVIARCS